MRAISARSSNPFDIRSGTKWRIEARGIADGGDKFVIVECRRYPRSRLDQEKRWRTCLPDLPEEQATNTSNQ